LSTPDKPGGGFTFTKNNILIFADDDMLNVETSRAAIDKRDAKKSRGRRQNGFEIG
jgi:hypothetical protein